MVTVVLISSSEIMKAEAAAAARLAKEFWLLMVVVLRLFGSAALAVDATLIADTVPIWGKRRFAGFLRDERNLALG